MMMKCLYRTSIDLIVFVAMATLSACQADHDCSSLNVYDADRPSDAETVREWYEMVRDPVNIDMDDDNNATAMERLGREACERRGRGGGGRGGRDAMCETFERVPRLSVDRLTDAECLAVTMYTHQEFGRQFNNALRYETEREKYKVFTKLLLSAVTKLSAYDPVPKNTPLYGSLPEVLVRCSLKPSSASRIYWPQFISVTPDKEVVSRRSGKQTQLLVFEGPQATVRGADIGDLSMYREEIILILPFEAFDVLTTEGQQFNFKVSQKQDIFESTRPTSFRSETTRSNTLPEMFKSTDTFQEMSKSTTSFPEMLKPAGPTTTVQETIPSNDALQENMSKSNNSFIVIFESTTLAAKVESFVTVSGQQEQRHLELLRSVSGIVAADFLKVVGSIAIGILLCH